MTGQDPVVAHLSHLELRNLTPSSITQRRYALGRLARWAGCSEPADLLALTGDDLDRWQRSIVSLSPRYRSTYATHVRQFYDWAQGEGLVRDNPARVLVTVRLPRTLPHPMGEDDVSMAIACAPERIRPWLVLAAYAGLRASEIAGLTRQAVMDTASPPVLLVHGKGGKERVVPLSDLVLMELRLAGLPARGFVFRRRDGKPGQNTPGQVSKLCNMHLHGLGIAESLHSLRHRFGSQMYRVSLDLRMTQEVMGHESPATTAGYVAWSATAAAEAVQRITPKRSAVA